MRKLQSKILFYFSPDYTRMILNIMNRSFFCVQLTLCVCLTSSLWHKQWGIFKRVCLMLVHVCLSWVSEWLLKNIYTTTTGIYHTTKVQYHKVKVISQSFLENGHKPKEEWNQKRMNREISTWKRLKIWTQNTTKQPTKNTR